MYVFLEFVTLIRYLFFQKLIRYLYFKTIEMKMFVYFKKLRGSRLNLV